MAGYMNSATNRKWRDAFSPTATPTVHIFKKYPGATTGHEMGAVRILLLRLIWSTLLGFLLWCLFGVVRRREWHLTLRERIQLDGPVLLGWVRHGIRWLVILPFRLLNATVRGIARSEALRFSTNVIRERWIRMRDFVSWKMYYLRHNWLTDLFYLYYQQVINWVGQHKAVLIGSIFVTWWISAIIQQHNSTSIRFMKWPEVQRYVDKPLPEVLFWQRKESGSNSHYHRASSMVTEGSSSVDDIKESPALETVTVTVTEVISSKLTADSVRERSTAGPLPLEEEREVHRVPIEGIAFCHFCKQKHCCEIAH